MARSLGGSSAYSYAASGASSSDYEDELDELENSPSRYFESAAAAVGPRSAAAAAADAGGESTPPVEDVDLANILAQDADLANTFILKPVRKHDNDHEIISPLESNSGERSPRQEHSQRYQEYYDVLEMANNRLSQKSQLPSRLDSDEAVILDEYYEQKRKSKKKKKKDKKEKRKQQKHEEDKEEDVDIDVDGRRRSSVFQNVFQPSLFEAHTNGKRASISSEAELRSQLEKPKHNGSFVDEENALDPNDEVPGPIAWSPAALVNASRSKQSGGRTNKQGFYTQVGGSTSATKKPTGFGGWVQNLMQPRSSDKELPKDYNLNSIGRSDSAMTESPSLSHSRKSSESKKKKKKRSKYKTLTRCDSIDWGDESALGDHDDDDEEESVISRQKSSEIEMKVVDSCSFNEINESSENWNANSDYIEKLVWYRDRRRLAIIVTLVVAFLAGCSALYFSDGNEKAEGSNKEEEEVFDATIKENVPDSSHIKEPHPTYPLPHNPPPIDHSVLQGGYDGSLLQPLSADEYKIIIEKITPDANVLSNSDTPQAKAMTWTLEDRTKYSVEVPARVGVRYALATLYYSTNGDNWLNNTNWKSGHECLWNGVYCELDENNIISLTYLNLVTNNLDGSIPDEIGYIESLRRIELGSNQLIGPIPETFSRLNELRTISVSDNQLTGEIGANIDGLTKLANLDLANNRFRGHVPHGLGGIPTLSYVRLSNNRFTGAFPTSFISLNNLHTLLIDNNAIGGTLPALMGMMKTLVNLRLHKNDFYGELPNFSDAILLETAHFDDNFFKGPLPQFGSKRLRELYLDKNSLTGAIPVSYGNHPKLQVLSARNNDISSTIPASLAKATNLGVLDLSYNKISGELSETLSQLTQLKQLYLNNNRLQGSFPSWLGSMENLEIAHFNNNLFSGDLQLGYEFEHLDFLKEFTIEFNQMVGMVPEDVCDLLLDVLTADCWGNPAAVECPCCTKCF